MLRLKHKLDKDHTLSCLDFQFCVFPSIGYFTIVMFDWCAVIPFFCEIMLRPKTDAVSDININHQSFSLIITLVLSLLCV